MGIYTVHEPQALADPAARADRTVVLRDRFSLAAFVFGPLYLLWHRLWLSFAIYLAAAVLAGLAVWALKLDPGILTPLALVAHVFVGLEGRDLRRWALERRGYRMAAVVGGRSRDEAELAFFRTVPPESIEPRAVPVRTPVPGRTVPAVIGMFDHGDLP